MSFYKEQNTRIRLKRTATSGATPTVGPSTNHTDGTWGINDIYGGEFFWNMADEKLWLGWNTGSTSGVTLIYPSSGSGGTYTADNGLTETPANNFQLGGALITDTYIDGASNTYGIELQDLTFFRAYTSDVARIDSFQGAIGGSFQIETSSPLTDWTFADGIGNTTAIEMNGLKMFVKAPGWNTGSNGDYFRLKDATTGESDWYPLPGSSSSYCITDFYVTNVIGCSPITMKSEVICESGLTSTTISATTYYNLPSSTFTGGSVSGATQFTGGLTANTISATTYENLPSSTFTGGSVSGATQFTGGLTANTISATTYQNLPVSAITAGTNIVVSNTNGNVTISTNNLGTNVIWKDAALYSSNATANTLVTSKLIPANTFQVDDLFESIASFSSNTINGQSQIVRLYINTSASLVGAQVLQTYTNTVGTGTYMGLYRHGFITATGSSGNLTILNTTLVNFPTSLAIGNTTTTQVTINTTVDQYLIWAIQMGSTTYTVQIRGINIKLTR